MMLALIIKIK